MKVLVFGGRKYTDRGRLWQALYAIHKATPITCIVHGSAPGADTIAEDWAKTNQIKYIGTPAQWDTFGTAAGPKRNARVIEENPDIELAVVAPGDRGTSDMFGCCARAGIWVVNI